MVIVAAVGLISLLAFGVAGQDPNSSIDAQVAHGEFPLAPSRRLALPVLGSSATQTLSGFHGKIVVLNIFASWCQNCSAETAILNQAQRQLGRREGTVLGVTYLDNSSDTEAFVKRLHITYPVVRDVSGSLVRSFGTYAVPETFVINRQGRIQALRRYQLTGTWLSRTVASMLSPSKSSAGTPNRRQTT
jgi:cytochrome c biogenesis protein CcmG/thiol:disulfide interchange protein DsbE